MIYLHIAFFTILGISLLIAPTFIPSVKDTVANPSYSTREITLQKPSLPEAEVGAIPDPCTLPYIFCDWKRKGIVTAYSSSVDETDDTPFITASGQTVRHGIVANNCEPFGKKVVIDGVEYEVQDRKNSRYGCDWWDIWMPSKAQAMSWGKRELVVLIK